MSALAGDLTYDMSYFLGSYEDPATVEHSFEPTACYEQTTGFDSTTYYAPMFEPLPWNTQGYESVSEASTPPNFAFDPALLDMSIHPNHVRSGSEDSTFSSMGSPPASTSSRFSTPAPATPPPATHTLPIRQHGPILLPKIRPQDQAMDIPVAPPLAKRTKRTSTPPVAMRRTPIAKASAKSKSTYRPTHARSYTNPESLSYSAFAFAPQLDDITASPVEASQDNSAHFQHARRSSSSNISAAVAAAAAAAGSGGALTFSQMPTYVAATPRAPSEIVFPSCFTKGPSASVARASPAPAMSSVVSESVPQSTLAAYLTTANPAPSLVRSISYVLRDPHAKHFWWDVRQVRSWNDFSVSTILSLPGAAGLLSCPVPVSSLPAPSPANRLPENEAMLHKTYAAHYLPKLNSALALCSARPLQLSVPTKTTQGMPDQLFVATVAGEPATAATIFGGKPSARVVGLVRSYDRFNTGMRAECNIKRVAYLRGLAALHHAMREHGTRYGFILTEIELVVVRNGTDAVPNFGFLEIASVQLNASAPEGQFSAGMSDMESMPMTACLALWGLCMMAGDEATPGQVHWRSEIGAPAEGTRRKAQPRDSWVPPPHVVEKREAKRSRGWILPEDAVGRKELGKRGVKYGAC
jgi:hypothetical protein